MCIVCIEYLKGKLTLEEADRAWEELEVLGDIDNKTEHSEEALEKMMEEAFGNMVDEYPILDEDDGDVD